MILHRIYCCGKAHKTEDSDFIIGYFTDNNFYIAKEFIAHTHICCGYKLFEGCENFRHNKNIVAEFKTLQEVKFYIHMKGEKYNG